MLINETKKWGAQVYLTHIIGGVNDTNLQQVVYGDTDSVFVYDEKSI